MGEDHDLVIVGGGPAGLATAIEAQRAGLAAVVLDRRQHPIDVACGEGLMPSGVDLLHGMGVGIEESETGVFRGIRFLDGEVEAVARWTTGVGLGVRRTVLHRALVHRAEELGADLRWGTTVRVLEGGEVLTDDERLRGRFVVAADGRLSRVRRMAGIATSIPARRRCGVRRHYRRAPWTDTVDVYWSEGGEAYVTPVGPEMIGIAMLTQTRPLDFDRQLRQFPELARRLVGAPIVSRDRGAGPFGHRPEMVVRGHVALVGDASGSLDPITGEGLSVAFAQARSLVRAIQRDSLASYVADHRRIMRAPRFLTEMLLVAEARPWLRRRMIRVFAAVPWLFNRIVDAVGRGGRLVRSRR